MDKGQVPNTTVTYNMLINGFFGAGKVKEGMRILEEMLGKGCAPNPATYCILPEALCCSGQLGDISRFINVAVPCGGVDNNLWDLFSDKFITEVDGSRGVLDRILSEHNPP